MGKEKRLRTYLFSKYSSASYDIIESLLESEVNIVGVTFAPEDIRRISRRSLIENLFKNQKIKEPKQLLAKFKIPYTFVENHNNETSKKFLKEANPDILILYGTNIIKSDVLEIPEIGCLNAHSSLLPKYRGAKSEFWMMYNDEPECAGVTIHWVSPGLDEGDIFLQEPLKILPGDTPDSMRKKSVPLASKLYAVAIQKIEKGEIIRIKQDEEKATKFKRPTKEEIEIFNSRKQ